MDKVTIKGDNEHLKILDSFFLVIDTSIIFTIGSKGNRISFPLKKNNSGRFLKIHLIIQFS